MKICFLHQNVHRKAGLHPILMMINDLAAFEMV